ncbi:MAG TPA: hypothetical protein VFO55_12350 [Gemmatimonadaceae bacterium]|nr:hypothetical protein [Gemmatimonadaceae bacterium]
MKRTIPAVLLMLSAGTSAAQSSGYGPLALTLPASARALGMGNIAVAGRDDDVIFFNPAQLVVARGTSISLARTSETARGATMSTVLRLGPAGIGFGMNHFEYQAPLFTYPVTRDDVLNRNEARGTSTLGSVGYAQVIKGFRLGASVNYATDVLNIERFSAVYGDIGIGRDFGRYSTALAVQHLGPSLRRGSEKIEAPATATLGVATSRAVGPLDVVATTALFANEERVSGGVGAEVGWSWISGYSVAGRAGFRQPKEAGVARYTAGFGFIADRLAIDVAAEILEGDHMSYRAGLRIR